MVFIPFPLSLRIIKLLAVHKMKDNCPILMQSEERDAPWNQEELRPIDVDCCVSYCMSKAMPISLSKYRVIDDDTIDLGDVNLKFEFDNDIDALGIPTLLCELKHLAEVQIERLKDEHYLTNDVESKKRIKKEIKYYELVVSAAQGWVVDDLDIEKE